VVAEVVKEVKISKAGKGLLLEQVLLNPHVTEKASDLSEKGVYAFNVNLRANKDQVTRAVKHFFKVTPVKVAMIVNKPKYSRNPRTNRVQVKKAAIKKALVYLKKGDKIEFV
jgi:large subunit ribosomal protein L23